MATDEPANISVTKSVIKRAIATQCLSFLPVNKSADKNSPESGQITAIFSGLTTNNKLKRPIIK